jgi:carbon storage regulator
MTWKSLLYITRGRFFLPHSTNGLKEFAAMLVLTRKLNETIVIDGNISVTVVGIRGNQVRLGITAPHSCGIYRAELCERNAAGRNASAPAAGEMVHTVA